MVAAGVLAVVLVLGFGSSTDEAAPAEPTPATSTPASPAPTPEPEVSIDETQSMPYTPVWNPPDAGDDFWQVVDPEEGYPEDGGTDCVLAHACRDRECAGDRIRDLEVEDRLIYRGEQYLVEEKLEILKTEIAEQDIGSHDPDRLVVITCILDPETGDYDENDIIVATRAG